MEYMIRPARSLPAPAANWDAAVWSEAETLAVTHYSWEDSGHHPPTAARLLYTPNCLAVMFQVQDQYVRAVARRFQDSVCRDSCAEFFVAPVPGSDAYFNFEVNCGGTMLVYRCVSQAERQAGKQTYEMTAADGATIAMAHTLPQRVDPEITEPTTWCIEYHLPHDLFVRYFDASPPAAGTRWRGNFYKCGDDTSHPHWGSWAPVGGARPSFHQPAYFQPLVFA